MPLLAELKSETDWRAGIQLLLHRDIHAQSRAQFFTPFFIKREGSNRAYWLVHLSRTAKARDVMQQVHWEIQNTSEHHWGAGLDMFGGRQPGGALLGYRAHRDSGLTPQGALFDFGEDARKRTAAALMEDIPRKLREAGGAMTLAAFRDLHCNYSPAHLEMLCETIGQLQAVNAFEEIVSPDGVRRRSAAQIDWGDRLVLKRQGDIFVPRES